MAREFVNRGEELSQLERWWKEPSLPFALVWGRRRVGKTALLLEFARRHRHLLHTFAGRPMVEELRLLSQAAASLGSTPHRDLSSHPFTDWDDLLIHLTAVAKSNPLLLVLDEFPEAVAVDASLPNVLRAAESRIVGSQLRILVCGSAVRAMHSLEQQRSPLYGRFDLRLMVNPFEPQAVGLLLPDATPSERAIAWAVTGGIPLYLSWWDTRRSVRHNLIDLVATPGQRLLAEGELVFHGETFGALGRQVLFAIAGGKTTFAEIADSIRTDPTRTLEALSTLNLVMRIAPVTDFGQSSRRARYQIADSFLAYWLGQVNQHQSAISAGLGSTVVDKLIERLDDFMGIWWERAVVRHVTTLAANSEFGSGIYAVGPVWKTQRGQEDPAEIDIAVIATPGVTPRALGEVKWARSVDARRIRRDLEMKATIHGWPTQNVKFIIAARETLSHMDNDVMPIVAADVFPLLST